MNNIRFIIFGILISFFSSAQAEIFKWVDENGKTHFGDKPPEDPQASVEKKSVKTARIKNKNIKNNDSVDISTLMNKGGVYYDKSTKRPFTGIATEFHKNGTKKMEVEIVHGRQHGLLIKWYKNGHVKLESNLSGGENYEKTFDKKGNMTSESKVKGKVHAVKEIEWSQSGEIVKETTRRIIYGGNGKVVSNKITNVKVIDNKSAASLKGIFNGIQAAYYMFIDKYRKVPGDWAKESAEQKIPGVTTGGNGDDYINDSGNGPWQEGLAAWEHLSKSGIYWKYLESTGVENIKFSGGSSAPSKGDSSVAPLNPFGGTMMLVKNKDYYDKSSPPIERTIQIMGAGIPVDVLAELDKLLDDGFPSSGVVRLTTTSNAELGSISQSNPACVDESNESTPVYNIGNSEVTCNGAYLY
jgi:antitoxin component YwqK of YwqJK toxin-antitoxin module